MMGKKQQLKETRKLPSSDDEKNQNETNERIQNVKDKFWIQREAGIQVKKQFLFFDNRTRAFETE